MPYGFILMPGGAESARMVEYSRHLIGSAPAIMMLGPAAPPHVTVVHITCALPAARVLWSRLDDLAGKPIDVTFVGLMFAPIPESDYYVPEGGVYVGLEAKPASELVAAHRAALTLAEDAGVSVLGAVGQDYRPHLTMGVLKGFPEHRISLPSDLVNVSLKCHWALGRLGDYGTFPEIIDGGSP